MIDSIASIDEKDAAKNIPSKKKTVKRVSRRKKQKVPTTESVKVTVPDSVRREMIAEAAYFIAQRRGFAPGQELWDWLEAEREIDAQLSKA